MFYILSAVRYEENVNIDSENLNFLKKGCRFSEFQYLDKKPIDIEISDYGGIEFQDFLLVDDIPIISNKFKNILKKNNVDNLFFKQINLTIKSIGIKEVYWLALPPRINCLVFDNSEIDDCNYAEKIVINEECIGNYEIFKISNVINQEIIITPKLKELIEKNDLTGVNIYKILD